MGEADDKNLNPNRQPIADIFTARKRSCGKVMFLQVSVILLTGGVCVSYHALHHHYISSCTVGGSQLVRRQHTGNIKCMMG